MPHNVDDYAAMLARLLPQGMIWRPFPGSNFFRLLSAFGAELARLEADAARLVREVTPAQADEALEDWEEELGLPDECSLASSDTERRRQIVLFRLQRNGLMNEEYFRQLALSMGYDRAEVYTVRPFRADVSLCGHAVWDACFHHVFFITLPSVFGTPLRMGDRINRRLRIWGILDFECLVRQVKPAHTGVVFKYE
ncbi:YmfQ family protein [Mailhella massiliensis]|uniref:YmfQ family protein n=1 Tax=Mailhella massiliensis TaxID=1903261 RepID=UPI0023F0330A|nr:putative phage tail protein [Mailhella massiliensis]